MELNKQTKSRSKSIQNKNNPESNKRIDKQPQPDIEFNLVINLLTEFYIS